MVWPIPAPTVTVYFDLHGQGGEFFTWDDPVRGWDSGYVWAGDIATDLTAPVISGEITRGRATNTDTIDVGTAQIDLVNADRALDPSHIGSPYFGNIKPGKRITVSVAGHPIFDGKVEDYNFGYGSDQTSVASIMGSDALAKLARTSLGAFTATAGQLPGERINEILSRPEVNFGLNRSIDTGADTLQGDIVEAGTNTLAYIQDVTRGDLGRFFDARDGTLTYRDRRSAYNNLVDPMAFSDGPDNLPPGDVFAYDAGAPSTVNANAYDAGLPSTVNTTVFVAGGPGTPTPPVTYPTEWAGFLSVEREYGAEQLFNHTIVSRVGGSTETFTDDTSVAEFDQVYSTEALFTDLLFETDQQSYDLGLYLLTRHAYPSDRFKTLIVDLATLTDNQVGRVLALDIGGLVRVLFTPDRVGDPIDQYCIIEGIHHQFGQDRHVITFDLSEAEQRSVFVWDDPAYGWDSGASWVY